MVEFSIFSLLAPRLIPYFSKIFKIASLFAPLLISSNYFLFTLLYIILLLLIFLLLLNTFYHLFIICIIKSTSLSSKCSPIGIETKYLSSLQALKEEVS